MNTNVTPLRRALPAAALLLLTACGGTEKQAVSDSTKPAVVPSAAATPTGKVITIEMISDDKGSVFKPNDIAAHRGDVLKFVLVAGVHNVNFLADSNPGARGLPAPSALAQLPGQAIEIPVNFLAGTRYYFQCDPHALLGMIGHVTVEP